MSPYLQPSPYEADRGEKIGRSPREIPLSDLKALLGHPTGTMKAIRAKCLDCVGHQPSEVRKCVATDCPLWPFRMGRNPFHGRARGQPTEGGDGEAAESTAGGRAA